MTSKTINEGLFNKAVVNSRQSLKIVQQAINEGSFSSQEAASTMVSTKQMMIDRSVKVDDDHFSPGSQDVINTIFQH
jgi:hypothetical protein